MDPRERCGDFWSCTLSPATDFVSNAMLKAGLRASDLKCQDRHCLLLFFPGLTTVLTFVLIFHRLILLRQWTPLIRYLVRLAHLQSTFPIAVLDFLPRAGARVHRQSQPSEFVAKCLSCMAVSLLVLLRPRSGLMFALASRRKRVRAVWSWMAIHFIPPLMLRPIPWLVRCRYIHRGRGKQISIFFVLPWSITFREQSSRCQIQYGERRPTISDNDLQSGYRGALG